MEKIRIRDKHPGSATLFFAFTACVQYKCNTFYPLIACAQYFATFSLGLRGASLTSTAYDRITEADAAILDEDIVKYRMVKKKGYVRLTTSLGLLFKRFSGTLTKCLVSKRFVGVPFFYRVALVQAKAYHHIYYLLLYTVLLLYLVSLV